MRGPVLALVTAVLALPIQARANTPAAPPPCLLKQAASLPVEAFLDGGVAVPVTLNQQPSLLEIDTGSIYSSVTAETARELGLDLKFTLNGGEFINGVSTDAFTFIDSITIGSMHNKERLSMIILPDRMVPSTVSGLLGPDIMRNYDVEFDFFRGRMNLFAHKTCPTAVYWTKAAYAVAPMEADKTGHIVVQAILDQKPLTVLFDTGSPTSIMSLEAARKLFAWPDKDPHLSYLRTVALNGGPETPFYSFPFESLSFEGIAIANPKIVLVPQKNFDAHGRDDAQVVLGMSVLRQLHFYVAYEEQRVYLTDAEAQ